MEILNRSLRVMGWVGCQPRMKSRDPEPRHLSAVTLLIREQATVPYFMANVAAMRTSQFGCGSGGPSSICRPRSRGTPD